MPAVHAANGVRLNAKVTIESIQSQPILRLHDFLWQMEAHTILRCTSSCRGSRRTSANATRSWTRLKWIEWNGRLALHAAFVREGRGWDLLRDAQVICTDCLPPRVPRKRSEVRRNFTGDERLDVYKQRRIDPEMASEFAGQFDCDFSIPSKNEGN